MILGSLDEKHAGCCHPKLLRRFNLLQIIPALSILLYTNTCSRQAVTVMLHLVEDGRSMSRLYLPKNELECGSPAPKSRPKVTTVQHDSEQGVSQFQPLPSTKNWIASWKILSRKSDEALQHIHRLTPNDKTMLCLRQEST